MFSVLVIILVVSGLSFLLGGVGLVLFFRLKGQLQDQGAQLTQFMDRFLSVSQEGQSQIRQEWSQLSQLNREEQLKGLKSFNDSILKHMTDISTLQKNQLDIFAKNLRVLTDSNDKRLESVRKFLAKISN
jgi:DNA recombination protein RmuC